MKTQVRESHGSFHRNSFLDGRSVSWWEGASACWGGLALSIGISWQAGANPQGLSVVSGSATATTSGSVLNVTVGQTAFLNWQSFNIGPGESTIFQQASASAVAFNWIGDANPSKIYGSVTANGTLILANAHGFYFGPQSFVSVGGSLILTTTALPPDMAGGSGWQFSGPPPGIGIVNYGRIESRGGGSLFIIAEQIENHGTLSAPGGQIGLYAGQEVLLSDRPDGRGVNVKVRLPAGSINNTGTVVADAGEIALQARTVNQDGVLQANSVRSENGVIELVAADTLSLGATSDIRARGNGSAPSDGGKVTLRSFNVLTDAPGSRVDASGVAGGTIELSAPTIQHFDSDLVGGHLVLDPTDIVFSSSGTGGVGPGGGVAAGDPPTTLTLNPATAFLNKKFKDITLEATRDITFAQGLTWDLSASTGLGTGTHQLTLLAGNNIVFQDRTKLVDANEWSVRLEAGHNFASGAVDPGVGAIYLGNIPPSGSPNGKGSGTIQTAKGGIQLVAGRDILVGSGYVGTVRGGSVQLNALSGDINTGTKNESYDFGATGYTVSSTGLGGVTTAHGGDVILKAGGNVISIPTTPLGKPPGASGAYGSEGGDVTVVAGGNITGNFLVRNGTGTLQAGVDLSDPSHPVVTNPASQIGTQLDVANLSLVSGSWSVWSGGDIRLGEIRNPNGTFNPNRLKVPSGQFPGNTDGVATPTRSAFLFDYAPDAVANLWAGNGINLVGENLPRPNASNLRMGAVYPPRLSLDAGAGGIFLKNSVILYPSASGSLNIVTRDGGDLSAAPISGGLVSLTVSDSGRPEYTTFADGHSLLPTHLGKESLMNVNISGNINNIALVLPSAATVQVARDTYNFGFIGQNLSPSDVTRIRVGGSIGFRGNLTDTPLSDGYPPEALDIAYSTQPLTVQKLIYSTTDKKLTWIGQMTDAERKYLLAPERYVYDRLGLPVLNADGSQRTEAVLPTSAQADAINTLFKNSQDASLGGQGLALSGPGQFNIVASRIDLGVSAGIFVATSTSALERLVPDSASISLDIVGRPAQGGLAAIPGDLVMTSSRISNEGLRGSITISTAGKVDVGAQETVLGSDGSPRGIYTAGGGDITVTSTGTINVNGSRVAAYDGGTIRLRSENGDINAGSGGSGVTSFIGTEWDTATQSVIHFPATIPGSGILSTTVKDGNASPGDVVLETPNGSIFANSGGVIQIPFNNSPVRASVTLTAGKDIESGNSGIIGGNIRLNAGGSVKGVVVGSGNVKIVSESSVSVSVLSGGSTSISAGSTISGTIMSGGSIDVAGGSITANLIAGSVSTTGDASGAAVGVPASNVPRADSQMTDSGDRLASRQIDRDAEDLLKRKSLPKPGLVTTRARVRVRFPGEAN